MKPETNQGFEGAPSSELAYRETDVAVEVSAELTGEKPEDQREEISVVIEVADMRIECVQGRKQERIMRRTLRWPIHSNTHRVTF